MLRASAPRRRSWTKSREGFRSRPLDRGAYTFVWVDALTQKVREGSRTVNVHCLIAFRFNVGLT